MVQFPSGPESLRIVCRVVGWDVHYVLEGDETVKIKSFTAPHKAKAFAHIVQYAGGSAVIETVLENPLDNPDDFWRTHP